LIVNLWIVEIEFSRGVNPGLKAATALRLIIWPFYFAAATSLHDRVLA